MYGMFIGFEPDWEVELIKEWTPESIQEELNRADFVAWLTVQDLLTRCGVK
jgi:hypothetical protein